ncbi:unnamed protein product, partial [Closterium sp. NIES-53]
MPTPSSSSSDETDKEPSGSPRRPLPQVKVPVFPESSRPRGQKKRVRDAETPETRRRRTEKKRKAYTVKEKRYWLKMLDVQPPMSVRGLAKLTKVQLKQIRDWRNLKERLDKAAGCHQRLTGADESQSTPIWRLRFTAGSCRNVGEACRFP